MEKILLRLKLANLISGVVAIVAIVTCLLVFNKSLPPQVPLLYSLPWGQDQLVSPKWLWGLPLVILVIGGGMTGWGQLCKQEKVLAGILFATGLVGQILVLGAFMRILLIVI